MKFVKMHGCGNDYVYLDALRDERVRARVGGEGWGELVRRMSDRHRGIGSDGVIAVCPPTAAGAKAGAQVRMRMFNADGSESEMCGNGVRCVAKFAHDRLGVRTSPMRVQTGRGTLAITYTVRRGRLAAATVDMGRPRLGPKVCGVSVRKLCFEGIKPHWGVERDGEVLIGIFVSMGNPHMVVYEPKGTERPTLTPAEVAGVPLGTLGPLFETHEAFKERMNVHFAGIARGRGKAKRVVMRTWERGAGPTQACGTGACAVVVAGVLSGRLARDVDVDLPGGRLHVRWDTRTGRVFMTGPADDVFEGEWSD